MIDDDDIDRALSAVPAALAFAGAFLVLGFLATRLAFRHRPVARFICQLASFAGLSVMLIIAGLSPSKPTPAMGMTLTYLLISALKIVWWLAGAWLLVGFLRAVLVFKRQPRETRFLQDLVAGFIYVSAILAIIAYVFDVPLTGLLAASGVVAIVLGLALQSTLGDVFSGIVLNLARPYHPGDWVILDGSGLQGRIVETNWQATEILTANNDLAVIPNSIIAKAKLINASRPSKAHGITIVIRLEPTITPSRAIATLETALLSSNRILRSPAPAVTARTLDAVALECEIQFFIPSSAIELAAAAQNEVFDLVFRHCAAAGMRLAPPSGTPVVPSARAAAEGQKDMPRRLLEHLPIFAPLSEDERDDLAMKMTRRTYRAGDVVVEQGAVAHALFILTSGVLAALEIRDTGEAEILRLAPGDCFGQSGILTGAAMAYRIKALTRATVYEVDQSDLAPILKNRPAVAAELGQILARRQAIGRSALETSSDQDAASHHLAERLTSRMKELFGLD